MKTPIEPDSSPAPRRELLTVLEHCGVSPASFESLRKDAYEKCLAAASVADLEKVYEALLDPALGLAEVRGKCPLWPAGSRNAGKLPSLMTLRDIKERILLDWSVQERLRDRHFAQRLRDEAPFDEDEFFGLAMRLLSSELMSAKLAGKPLGDNLPVFDRLLKVWNILTKRQYQGKRQELSDRMMALRKEEQEWKRGLEAQKSKNKASVPPVTAVPKEVQKPNPPAPAKIQTPKAPAATGKAAGGLSNLVPSLDLGLGGGLHRLNGKGYDATVKSLAEQILAVGGPS